MIDQKESTSTRAHNDDHSPEQGAQSITWLFGATLTTRLTWEKSKTPCFAKILIIQIKLSAAQQGQDMVGNWEGYSANIIESYPRRNVDKSWLFFSCYSQKSRYLTSCNPTSTERKDTRPCLLILLYSSAQRFLWLENTVTFCHIILSSVDDAKRTGMP